MSRYLYISDVYCPWCYAFGRILDELLAEHPLPVRVLAGELVEEPQTIDDMVREMPSITAFFKRLADTTGRGVGQPYLDLLEPGKGTVGTRLALAHTAPTPVGMTVRCDCTLTAVDGRRLTFTARVCDAAGEVAHAEHERVVIDNDRFTAKAQAKTGQ